MEDKNSSGMTGHDGHDRQFQNEMEGKQNADQRDAAPVSGDEIISDGLENKHHQQHGNRKYQAFSNHSSAGDHPGTITGTTPHP